jgi:hypothetical protein
VTIQELQGITLAPAPTPAETNRDLVTAQISAKTFAARLYQKFHRANPPEEWLKVAVPMFTLAILEGRTDLVKSASQQIHKLAKDLEVLRQCNRRQAEIILTFPERFRGTSPSDDLANAHDGLGGLK